MRHNATVRYLMRKTGVHSFRFFIFFAFLLSVLVVCVFLLLYLSLTAGPVSDGEYHALDDFVRGEVVYHSPGPPPHFPGTTGSGPEDFIPPNTYDGVKKNRQREAVIRNPEAPTHFPDNQPRDLVEEERQADKARRDGLMLISQRKKEIEASIQDRIDGENTPTKTNPMPAPPALPDLPDFPVLAPAPPPKLADAVPPVPEKVIPPVLQAPEALSTVSDAEAEAHRRATEPHYYVNEGRTLQHHFSTSNKGVTLEPVSFGNCRTPTMYCEMHNVMVERIPDEADGKYWDEFANKERQLGSEEAPMRITVYDPTDSATVQDPIRTAMKMFTKASLNIVTDSPPICDEVIDTRTFWFSFYWYYGSNYFHIHYDTMLPLHRLLIQSELLSPFKAADVNTTKRADALFMPIALDRSKHIVWNATKYADPFGNPDAYHLTGIQMMSRHPIVPWDIRNFPQNEAKRICFKTVSTELSGFRGTYGEKGQIDDFIQFMKYQALGVDLPHHERVQKVNKKVKSPRVGWISRHNRRNRRRVINEDEVVMHLQQELEVPVDLIDFKGTIADQIRMVQDYSLIIGMNGAGFMNVIYMPPGSVSVQLVPTEPPVVNWVQFGSLVARRGPYFVWHNTRKDTNHTGGDTVMLLSDALAIAKNGLSMGVHNDYPFKLGYQYEHIPTSADYSDEEAIENEPVLEQHHVSSGSVASLSDLAAAPQSDLQRTLLTVHMLVPHYNRVDGLRQMLRTLTQNSTDQNYLVHLVDFKTETMPEFETADLRREFLQSAGFKDEYDPRVDFWSVPNRATNFSLAKGRHFAAERARNFSLSHGVSMEDTICSVMDVDMDISPGFIALARDNVIAGKRAVVFNIWRSQQNNKVKDYKYDDYSSAITAFALSDCIKAGGMADATFMEREVWGNEDSSYLRRLKKALENQGGSVERIDAPGVVHRWHGRGMDDPWYADYYKNVKKTWAKNAEKKAAEEKAAAEAKEADNVL